jgi:hypothetical protein
MQWGGKEFFNVNALENVLKNYAVCLLHHASVQKHL